MRGLKDKVTNVAGAGPGNIGGATAVRLAQEGAKVIAADLDEAAAQAVVDEISAAVDKDGLAVHEGAFSVAGSCAVRDWKINSAARLP